MHVFSSLNLPVYCLGTPVLNHPLTHSPTHSADCPLRKVKIHSSISTAPLCESAWKVNDILNGLFKVATNLTTCGTNHLDPQMRKIHRIGLLLLMQNYHLSLADCLMCIKIPCLTTAWYSLIVKLSTRWIWASWAMWPPPRRWSTCLTCPR